MKFIFTLFFLFMSFQGLCVDVDVFVNPKSPIVNEPFYLIFSISMEGDENPYITFDQGDLVVQGRENRGSSRKVTIINGKISSRTEVVYAYEILAERGGNKRISNIKVDVGGQVYTPQNLNFKVYDTPPRPQKIFVNAEISKDSAYVGEGIDVKYYLYYKVPILQPQVEIQEYPDFKDFLKRFYMVNQIHVETVQYQGEMYKRELRYSARIFPVKNGDHKIGRLKLRVPYASSNGYNRFGFGFGFNNVKSVSVQNQALSIEVKSLPVGNIPSSFTGLVGNHKFTLKNKRDKYLVNEVVEFELEVEGDGALESYDAPVIYNSPALESFDVKSEIVKIDDVSSKKIFSYTLLARAPIELPALSREFSFFDPALGSYKTETLLVPGLTVAGVAGGDTSMNSNTPLTSSDSAKKQSLEHFKLVAPIFYVKNFNFSFHLFRYLNITLIILVILQIFWLNSSRFKEDSYLSELKLAVKCIRDQGPEYSNVYKLLKDIKDDESDSLFSAIEGSHLSKASKNYFKQLLSLSESSEFTRKGEKDKFVFSKKSFKELLDYLMKNNATS